MFRQIVSDGIELRILEERDAGALFAVADRNRASLREWLPWVDHTRSPDDSLAFIRAGIEQHLRNEGFHCGIWRGGSLAGAIGIHKIDWQNRATSIGYWLDASCRGGGVTTSSCRVILDHLFGELGLNRVEIRCGTGNRKSCAIPERLGFTREGVLRQAQLVGGRFVDLVVYGMLRSDWLAIRAR